MTNNDYILYIMLSVIPKNNLSVVKIKSNFNWQWPALTEKKAMHNHECDNANAFSDDDNIYVGCPWASVIDFTNNKYSKAFDFMDDDNCKNYLLNNLDIPDFCGSNTHTVCQSIYWRRMVGFWKYIGIKNVYLSHLTEGISFNDLYLHPWHLIAPNTEIPKRNKDLIFKPYNQKKYLCSFVGGLEEHYKKLRGFEIRSKLKNIISDKPNVFFELKDYWFYHSLVYEYQIMKKNISHKITEINTETVRYNQILSDSIFSICPEGTGPNTLRLWESMSIGAIPVLFESNWVKPHANNLDWSSFSITIPQKDIENTYDILSSFPKDRIEKMQINCINAYNHTRSLTCF